ncbi:MAG: RDD family protein [Thermonemataceae bacterium]
MQETLPRRKAKYYFYLLTVFFIVAQILATTATTLENEDEIMGMIVWTGIFLIFITLTIKGYKWAKWMLTVLLVFFSILFLLEGFETSSMTLKLVGIYYLYFGLIPHFSKQLRSITHPIARHQENDSTTQKVATTSTSDEHNFPYLIDRYKATLIDGLLLFGFTLICVQLKNYLNFNSTWLSILFFLIIFSYEPVLIAYSSTIGQKVMKIRVRSLNNPSRRIPIGQAYIRFLVKVLLGWLSFITISFDKNKRAIHDFTASSIVTQI